MIVTSILRPLPGEHLAATWPIMRIDLQDPRPGSDPGWRKRVRFWSGRSVNAEALEDEQRHLAARVAWQGRAVTPGVVRGLEAAFEAASQPVDLSVTRVASRAEIPEVGTSRAFVAELDGALHLRVFDADGNRVRDVIDRDIPTREEARQRLRDRVGALGDPIVLPEAAKSDILADLADLLEYRIGYAGHFVHVLPGTGITLFGEDVVVPRALRADLAEIPVRGMAAGETPWAAVLVVRPAEVRRFDNLDPTDPCELDPSKDAFADERRYDAAILELVPLPTEWQNEVGDPADERWRNRIVHRLFRDEAERSARAQIRNDASRQSGQRWSTGRVIDGPRPWEAAGVPLALLSSEAIDAGTELFLDRAAVVRSGGLSRARTRPATRVGTAASAAALNPLGAGNPRLWRARVDQLAEQIGALGGADLEAVARRLHHLPPAGLLPREALELIDTADAMELDAPDRAAASRFFPATMRVEAVPVTHADLDAALAASAPLAPFDLVRRPTDVVRMLVPVPEQVFDPELLVVEREDPAFVAEIGRLVGHRQDVRQSRDFVRTLADVMLRDVTGEQPARPATDPGQFEPEPVESRPSFTVAFLSPVGRDAPWELFVPLNRVAVERGTEPFLLLRSGIEGVGRIQARWQYDDGREVAFTWDSPPDFPPEQRNANGDAVPTELWRFFVAAPDELRFRSGSLVGVSIRLESGRVALTRIGELRGSRRRPAVWWNADDNAPEARSVGATWERVTDLSVAPFEDRYEPVFDDGLSRVQRLREVEVALNPPAATPRVPATNVDDLGLDRALELLEAEADDADDFVDANFVRAQTNLYRIRKHILGEKAAQQLLINPAIATIADQQTANASAEQLASYLKDAKETKVKQADVRDALRAERTRGAGGTTTPRFTSPAERRLAERREREARRGRRGRNERREEALRNVRGQRAESGPILTPRGLSLGKRFHEPPATANLAFARASLKELVDALPRLGLPLVDEVVTGLTGEAVDLVALQGRALPTGNETTEERQAAAVTKLFRLPNITDDTDEAEVTLAALDLTEIKSAILRVIERAVANRRRVIERGHETLAVLEGAIARARRRVAAIEPDLEEARHDVNVARALRQEELQRIAEINDRRDEIVREHVQFLAYVRPREVDLARRTSTAWQLGHEDQPRALPECLARHDEPPQELQAYVELFRHVPVKWFARLSRRLGLLDTSDKLTGLLLAAQHSAVGFVASNRIPFAPAAMKAGPRAALQSAFAIVAGARRKTSRLVVGSPFGRSWREHRRAAEEHASLGDVIDGRHGHRALSRRAAEELENIAEVATCLHAEFAGVPPAIRLAWVERYSQFDRPSPLDDLTVLPQYGKLERATRRRFQSYVDWLYVRVDRNERDATALINDLVRICLLLGSHAPVKQIISGRIPRPVPVRPGVLLPIRPLDPGLVRVGMQFQVWRANEVVARGLVEDIEDEEVQARVDHVAFQKSDSVVDPTMRVQFVAQAFRGAAPKKHKKPMKFGKRKKHDRR